MADKLRVLFLCTGNSCRSQMAEALLRHHRGQWFEAHSAGTEPRPIHPLTLQVLEEKGVSTDGLRSKDSREYLGTTHFAFVIVVCAHAALNCPTTWPETTPLHMFFDDPAAFEGTDQEKLVKFRAVRDEIEQQVVAWADSVLAAQH
jgi:arsenate reductase